MTTALTPRERLAHVKQLCKELDVRLVVGRSYRMMGSWYHVGRTVEVETTSDPIWGATTYMIALHELGHAANGDAGFGDVPMECRAWRWAIDNAKELDADALAWGLGPEALGSYTHAFGSTPDVTRLVNHACRKAPEFRRKIAEIGASHFSLTEAPR